MAGEKKSDYTQDAIAEMVALAGKAKRSRSRQKRVRAAARSSVQSAPVAGVASSRFDHAHQCDHLIYAHSTA